MKVFLDANVLFSAALPESRMRLFLDHLRTIASLVSSQAAVDEARRNIERKAPAASQALGALLEKVALTTLVAEMPGVELVQKDRHILGAAVAAQCSHLLTGDERHFKQLFGTTVMGVRVAHARMLAEEIGLKSSKTRGPK